MPESAALRIAVSGADGLIGRHLRGYLRGIAGVEVLALDRGSFQADEALRAALVRADAVVHLAGMNRGDEKELEAVNVALAGRLIGACESSGARPHVVFASSAHINRDTAYARSKREAARRFSDWAARAGAPYTTLILPHVFGEGGRPFYNSAVSTFCHQLARGEKPQIIHDGDVELLHAQRLAESILEVIRKRSLGDISFPGQPMKASGLLRTLTEMDEAYRRNVIPDLREPWRLDLFNTLRSYYYPALYPIVLTLREDARGALFEAVKTDNGGQAFLSTTKPGVTRGNHYHRRKVERFLVVRGEARIRIRQIFSEKATEFLVDGRKPCYIDIPTLHTHDITNVGTEDLLTLFWAHEIFSPESPDTFSERV